MGTYYRCKAHNKSFEDGEQQIKTICRIVFTGCVYIQPLSLMGVSQVKIGGKSQEDQPKTTLIADIGIVQPHLSIIPLVAG
ncbi:MAG: hypothetical protein ACTJLL_00475 [Anaplasma sp.]